MARNKPKYILSTETKVIHSAARAGERCNLDDAARAGHRSNRVNLDVAGLIESEGYRLCFYCYNRSIVTP